MNGLPLAIAFGILASLVLYFAGRAGYFSFQREEMKWQFPIRWHHVLSVFVMYFAVVIFLVPLLSSILRPFLTYSPAIALATWLNFLTSFIILAAIALYCSAIPREVAWKMWRRSDRPYFFQDMGFALLSFVIAFPVVIFLNEVFDLLLYHFFQVAELPDQLAVRFLKMTFQYPSYLFLSIVTVVLFAPMLEEVLFRGFLQSFIRQHLGSKWAIFITAFCFSVFHYSPEQGASNFSIISSLFAIALFLGFVYEKRGSLAASISLHVLFNAINVLNLYYLGGFPTAI